MLSKPSVSPSDGLVDNAVERRVETQLQARREEFAQGISRYIAPVCTVMSLALVGVWALDPPYLQILLYASLLLLLAFGAGLYLFLQRRNRTTIGLVIVNGVSLIVILVGPFLIPSLLPVVGITDVIAMMIGIMLLGDRGSRWLVSIFALAFIVDVIGAAILHWSPFPPLEHSIELWIVGVVSLVGVVTAILLIRLIVLGQEQQFRQVQRLNLELEQRIQEVNETQAALKDERNLLRTLIDNVPDYIFIKDHTRRYLLSNLAHARAAGVSAPAELIGKTAAAFFPSDYVLQHDTDDETVLRGESIIAQERQTVNEDGTHIWVLTTKVPLRDTQGNITGVVGISRNITARKQAEETLRENEAKLKTFFDVLPVGVSVLNDDGQIIEMNPALERILGISMDGLLRGAYRSRQYTASDGSPMEHREFPSARAQVEQQAIHDVEVGVVKGDGTTVWTSVSAAPLPGTASGVITVTADITERKWAEEALRESEARFRQLMDHLQVAFWMMVPDSGQFLYMSSAYETITGRTCASLYQDPLSFLAAVHPDDAERVRQNRWSGLASGRYETEFRVIRPDGSICWVSGRTFPIFNEQGVVYRVAGITEDISERKQAEQQALELQNERQRAQVLHEFIGDATHDLMTPIAIINTSTDLARRAPTPERLMVHLGKIERMSETLQERLQEMLTMSQLDMMTAEDLELRNVGLAPLIRGLNETFRPRAEANGQQLSTTVDPQVSFVRADDLYLGMALAKIIENAIHYTEKGGTIHISIAHREAQVAIAICDTGIGIAEDELTHIFERFYRAKSHRPLDSGAGLGLSIAQRIIDLHSGRIEVSSVVGSGSTFTILLPDI